MIADITKFGAVESDALSTPSIQAAIDACHFAGGGEVVVPEGIFRVGTIWLRSNVTLRLLSGAMLVGSERAEDYSNVPDDLQNLEENYPPATNRIIADTDSYSRWNRAVIKAVGAENIAVIGEKYSYIDGVDCWDGDGEEGYRGPHGVNLKSCKNVILSGYTLKNSANWAHALFACENVSINGVKVLGGHDGIDIFVCKNVEISDCTLHTGDDCIAGYGSLGVKVRGCDFSTACSVFRFGGTDVYISDCTQSGDSLFCHRFKLTDEEKKCRHAASHECRRNTLTAFLYYCDTRYVPLATPGNIVFDGVKFDSVDAVFHINFGNHIWCSGTPLASVTFKNCSFGGVCESTYIYADDTLPFELTLENVNIGARSGFEAADVIEAARFSKITMKNVRFSGYDSPTVSVCCDGQICAECTDSFSVVKKPYELNRNSK